MKTSLDHLPKEKQEQIIAARDLILSKVPDVDKIILFGSYAKGKWVEDRFFENNVLYEYISDFDILVVTKRPNDIQKEYLFQDKIVNAWKFPIPINPYVHNLQYVNEGLETGQYFFIDIIREGIFLYNEGEVEFSKPKLLSPKEQKELAILKYDKWFKGGVRLLKYAKSNLKQSLEDNDDLKDITFLLHQVVERFYGAVLLVYGNYKPKTHNLSKLRDYIKPYSPELYHVFSPLQENEIETSLFSLLKRGYIDARYKEDFTITEKNLQMLISRLDEMADIVQKACSKRISEF